MNPTPTNPSPFGPAVTVAPDALFPPNHGIICRGRAVFGPGFVMQDRPARCEFGDELVMQPNVFIQGAGSLVVGDQVTFYTGSYLSLGPADGSIQIGSHTHFAPRCVLYGHGSLRIGNHCNIAAHVVFATVEHDPTVSDRPMSATRRCGPIVLEDDVWIGANSVIVRNVRIATGCVIGAGAVVTHDTEPHGIYLGVPARRVRERPRPG